MDRGEPGSCGAVPSTVPADRGGSFLLTRVVIVEVDGDRALKRNLGTAGPDQHQGQTQRQRQRNSLFLAN